MTDDSLKPRWKTIDSAPKDGKPFLAWCIERPPFSPAPSYFYDIARWRPGLTEHTGHFASNSGAICTHWQPLPDPPLPEPGEDTP